MPRLYYTTTECARLLEVSAQFIRQEIDGGLLQAEVKECPVRPGRRHAKRRIRVTPEQLRQYAETYWPRYAARVILPNVSNTSNVSKE